MGQFITGKRNMGTELFAVAFPSITFMVFMIFAWPIFLMVCLGFLGLYCTGSYLETWKCKKYSWIRHKENGKWVYE